jgi:hypothetical protein
MNLDTLLAVAFGAILALLSNFILTTLNNQKQLTRDELQRQWQAQQEINKRWWEQKLGAYSRIVEALYELFNYYDLMYSAEMHEIILTEKSRAELNNNFPLYMKEIKKSANIGIFIISPNADKVIRDYLKPRYQENDESYDLWKKMDLDFEASRKCINDFIASAKDDLKISEYDSTENFTKLE